MPRVEQGPAGSYIIYGRGHGPEGTLVQSDWDFPSVAQDLGWSLLRVQVDKNGNVVHLKRVSRRHSKVNCEHDGTDGTVTCPGCGLKAGDFISAAAEFLDSKAY